MKTTPDEILKRYFSGDSVLAHYLRATAAIGLWASEELLVQRYFKATDTLLEVGCGTGRIAFGMHELGYQNILGVDISRSMVQAARDAARSLEYGVSFQVGDATELSFDDGLFEGAIFGFNGLMQIPSRARRRLALAEIHRVLVSGSPFIFTTHDRQSEHFRNFWIEEQARWASGRQDARLIEFGDRILATPEGELYIHVPDEAEIREDLMATGWTLLESVWRDDLVQETRLVRDFADACRFWVARK
jgi:SAM-dependent methyltransferase